MKKIIIVSLLFLFGCDIKQSICSQQIDTIQNLQFMFALEFKKNVDLQEQYNAAQEELSRRQETIDRLMLELKDHRELYCPACDCDNCR